jgi:hypothetical protein
MGKAAGRLVADEAWKKALTFIKSEDREDRDSKEDHD